MVFFSEVSTVEYQLFSASFSYLKRGDTYISPPGEGFLKRGSSYLCNDSCDAEDSAQVDLDPLLDPVLNGLPGTPSAA